MTFKKTLINFAMIQTVIAATSINVGIQLPASNGSLMAIGFVWIMTFLCTFMPALVVSFLFAHFSK
jgi:hypothetical protein